MSVQERLIAKYGDPTEDQKVFAANNLVVWDCVAEFPWLSSLRVFGQPFRKMYVHKALVDPLRRVFKKLYERGWHTELKTFDGCWMVRYIRGYEKEGILSIHAFALAVDFNAAENGLGMPVKFSEGLIKTFEEEGFTAGARFTRKDGMHFEYVKPVLNPTNGTA